MHAEKISLTADTLFADSQQLGLDYVLAYNPDRMLAPVYTALGKKAPAPTYGGWESRQIQGHMLGHYLSALSAFYYQTGSLAAKEKLDYTVSALKKLQEESAFDGYLGGIPPVPFTIVFSAGGNFSVERFSLAGWWVPWYSVHKIYAGLLDAYSYGSNEDALQIVKKMADWAIRGTGNMSDGDLQKMLTCEHGGMCKVFADLYGITKDSRYLQEAERWIHREIVEPAMREEDALQGYHANTQIPKFIGLARLYELTGKEEYRRAAEFFFETVTEKRSYAIGGNSKGEHFGREFEEPLAKDTCETCNTYNMLELAEHIFAWNKKAAVADFYERALYNHILASQDPDSGAKTYFVAMQPGFHKVYCSHDNAMWCCTGTGLENPGRYNRFIASEGGESIYVNLFIPSTITTADGWQLQLETNFPYGSQVQIRVLQAGSGKKILKVRAPRWCASLCSQAGQDGYVDFGSLQEEKTVSIQLPMELSIRRAQDRSGFFSIFYGPLVLAADLGNQDMPADIVDDQLVYMASGKVLPVSPILADLKNPKSWITLTDAKNLVFATDKSAAKDGSSFTLKPFFAIHHVRYATYFASQSTVADKRLSELEKITLDSVEAGRQQSEMDHAFATEHTLTGYIESVDRNYRQFEEDGFVSYRLKSKAKSGKRFLVLTLYGKDSGSLSLSWGQTQLETLQLSGDGGDKLVDIKLPLPKEKPAADKKRTELLLRGSAGLRLLEVRLVSK